MPKLKTHKGAAKRFKKTGSGKVVRGHAFARHILTSKPRKRKNKLHTTVVADESDQALFLCVDGATARARSAASISKGVETCLE